MLRRTNVAFVGLLAVGMVDPVAAQDLEIELEEVASGLNEPVAIAHAGDGSGRLFVAQQTGEIRIVSGGTVLPEPFLDLSDQVSGGSEQGLLGLVFHPDYASNGFFYVDYTDVAGDTVVARYEVFAGDPNQADPESARTVLTQGQPFANHNAGQLAFGPDGYLYIALGDGGSGGDPQDNAQDLGTWLGKILRVDVDGDDFPADPDRNYAVPPNNPFVGAPGLDEIWAYGLRNPWRFSFDRATGDLWIADVGQFDWEEIDFQPAASEGGENYGWDVLEGGLQPGTPGPNHPNCFEDDPGGDGSCADYLTGGSVLPVLEYGHSLGCSVTGGYRYRGQLEPELAGVYFYADFCSGRIWGAVRQCGGTWSNEELLDAPFNITTFGEDEAGEIYVVESNASQSKLHRIVAAPGAKRPTVRLDSELPELVATAAGTLVPPWTTPHEQDGNADVSGLGFTPRGLEIDPGAQASDCNGVFEPGESVVVAPVWRNDGATPQALSGAASDFTGPGTTVYTLADADADYGVVDPGQTVSCLDIENCYVMGLSVPATRPATHWEATFDEALDDDAGSDKTWTLHIGASFDDVPTTSPFYPAIETLLHGGITGGCTAAATEPEAAGVSAGRTDGRDGARPLQAGGAAYCPGGPNSRAQMPVFVLRALEGADYVPPPCVEGDEPFDDVPFDSTFCPWIQDLADQDIVSGCGDGDYCPGTPVSRAQMSIFLLKTLEGAGYDPPECSNQFTDVPCPSLFADWIEDLATRGITSGCSPTTYCPGSPVSRAQMAVFVNKTFGLTLYGP